MDVGTGSNVAGQTATIDWGVLEPLLIPATNPASTSLSIAQARVMFGTKSGYPSNGFGNFTPLGTSTPAALPTNSDNSLLQATGTFIDYSAYGATIRSGQYYADADGVLTQVSNEDDAVLALMQTQIQALENQSTYDVIIGQLSNYYQLGANKSYVAISNAAGGTHSEP